jgi:AraC-like DNA-binding protein
MNIIVPKDNMNSAQYEIYYKNNIPNIDHPLHYHDFYELYFHVQGKTSYIINNKIYNLQTGDIVLIDKQQLHRAIIEDMTEKYLRYVIWMTRDCVSSLQLAGIDFINLFESPHKKDVIRLPERLWQDMLASLQKLHREYTHTEKGSGFLVNAYLHEVLILLNRYSAMEYVVHENSIKNDTVVQIVMEYIDHHYSEPLSLDKISQQFFLSKFYLMRKFKKHTGLTIMDYCRKKRLMRARELLLQNIAVSDVYKLCGFEDYTNFLKAFRFVYKMSPREYCKILKNNNASGKIGKLGDENTH